MSTMKLTSLQYGVGYETPAEQSRAGRYNPARTVEVTYKGRDVRMVVSSGTGDYLWVFACDDVIYVVTRNAGLGYCGLEAFNVSGERTGDVFVEDYRTEEYLGEGGQDLSPGDLCRRLSEYLPY
jgi:hypothetical protein